MQGADGDVHVFCSFLGVWCRPGLRLRPRLGLGLVSCMTYDVRRYTCMHGVSECDALRCQKQYFTGLLACCGSTRRIQEVGRLVSLEDESTGRPCDGMNIYPCLGDVLVDGSGREGSAVE